MNAERLHAIAEELLAEVRDSNYPEYLDQLVNGLQAAVETPNEPGPQEQISAARESLTSALREAPSNEFSPAWRQALEEIGVPDLLGDPLADELDRIFTQNEITPKTALDEVTEIRDRVQSFASALEKVSSALGFFKIGTEQLSPGEFEIDYMIPRRAVDNGLEELAKELIELKEIIAPFSELAGEGRPEIKVRSVSSSDFQVFLDSAPATAALIATTAERVLAAYERILNIRNLRRQLADAGVSDDALAGVSNEVSEGMRNEIREIAENVVAEADVGDEGRMNELQTEINMKLSQLAERIDRGYNIDVRVGEVPESTEQDDEEPDFDSATRSAMDKVLGAQKGLGFMNVSGSPILYLERPDEEQEPEDEAPTAA